MNSSMPSSPSAGQQNAAAAAQAQAQAAQAANMQMMAMFIITNPIFRSYVFWASILCIKMLLMALLTAYQRFSKKVFVNPEDARMAGTEIKISDPDVDRVRRAHQNDIENILLYIPVAFYYSISNPNPYIAIMLFRIFTVARILHTIIYTVIVIRQPARSIVWVISYLIIFYMSVVNTMSYFNLKYI